MVDEGTQSYSRTDRGHGGGKAPSLVIALQAERLASWGQRYALRDVDRVAIGRASSEASCAAAQSRSLRIDLDDAWTSEQHALLERRAGRWCLEDLGSKNGTFVNGERARNAQLADGDILTVGGTWLVYREREALLASEQPLPAALRTSCPELAKEFERLARVARSPHVPVLILGDSGAGKELVARAVHEVSERKGAFVPINCGALPEDLIESQLFGHRKGAFSGATEHQSGLARTAHEGTLFLDEVAELSPQAQVKLLRMLQENEVLPVGATRPVKVDVRVVAATNQPLEARVEAGAFRSDLYARLVGYRFRVPALRDRIEDLGMLTCALLTELVGASRANELTLHREAAQRLFAYDWPLNIRELQHALAAAVALTDGTQIEPEALPPELQRTTPSRAPPSMDETEFKHHLIALLEKHKGNVSGVARQMGKARAQIHRWCKRFDIAPESFR